MDEAFKMRNLLQEFLKKHDGGRYPSILGVREHIFTGRFVLYLSQIDKVISRLIIFPSGDGLHIFFVVILAVFHLLHGSCQIRSIVL